MEKKKGTFFKKHGLPLLIGGSIGILMGFGIVKFEWIETMLFDGYSGNAFIDFGLFVLVLVVSMYIHIIIHEGGHLVMGLATGYRFKSFRIGDYMLIKKEGRYELKKYRIAGTGGQCLLEAPQGDPETMPYLLYNLGGGLMNALIVALCIPFVRYSEGFMNHCLILFIGVGVVGACSNLIPLKLGGIPTDGYNIKAIRKDTNARIALWQQLMINSALIDGKSFREIPKSYYEVAEDADKDNPLIMGSLLNTCSYLQSIGEFELAAHKLEILLSESTKLPQLYEYEIHCELILYELLGACREVSIQKYYSKELQQYIKQSRIQPSKQCLLYAYHLCFEHDEEAASKVLQLFEKSASKHPYPGEIETFRMILSRIQEKHERYIEAI